MAQRVLFICTGNYYRSRFAEAVFNHHAEMQGLGWGAFSRGLAIHLVPPQFALSPQTEEGLEARTIPLRHTSAPRAQLREEDLHSAQLIIALEDAEHRPMVRTTFPHWENKMRFWDIGDQPHNPPEAALPAIEMRVLGLIEQIRHDALELDAR